MHLHDTQQRILRLSRERNLAILSLREIGDLIGVRSAQIVKHHILQLQKKGLMDKDKSPLAIEMKEPAWAQGVLNKAVRLFTIPVLGWASASPNGVVAEEGVMGYLRASSKLVHRQNNKGLFALKVEGPSMNRAEIDGKNIEPGDYVIVDGNDRNPDSGDIVLSIIDGMANIKRFRRDRKNKQIVLSSESTKEFPPIFIHSDDGYMVNGKVVAVMKQPK